MERQPLRSLVWPDMALMVVILFAVQFIRGAALISFLPIFGKNALGLSLDVIGAAITAHYFCDTCLKLAIGYLLDRLPVRTIVRAGLLASLAGMLAIGYAAGRPWLFIAAAALYGVGVSPVWIVCLTRVREERRGTQMGFLYTVWLAGLGAGPMVTNALLEVSYTWSYVFMVGVSFLAWLLAYGVREDRNEPPRNVPFPAQWQIMRASLNRMKPLLPGMVLQTAAAGMLLPILPSFAETYLGFSPTQYSLLLLLGGGCTVLGLIPMGRLTDRFGQRFFLTAGFLCFGLALYALTLHPAAPLAMVWALALGLSYSAVLPAWNALLAAHVPPAQRGLGWGIFSTMEGLGGVIGPLVGGLVAAAYGEPLIVGIAAAFFGVIGLVYLFLPFRLPEHK